jgi:DNA-directed RNA polymerase subunit alpha
MKIEKGLGYAAKEVVEKDRTEIGHIALDAIFSPIRRVNYEVENMRVGDRTDFNRLRIFIETDGTITPKEALEKYKKEYSQYWNAILSGTGEITLEETTSDLTEISYED